MDVEYCLVNDVEKTYLYLGKDYHLADNVVVDFLARSYSCCKKIRIIPNTGKEYDDLFENGYRKVGELPNSDEYRRKTDG